MCSIPLVLYRVLQFRVPTSKHCHEAMLGLMGGKERKYDTASIF
jgi:hypothetical protein